MGRFDGEFPDLFGSPEKTAAEVTSEVAVLQVAEDRVPPSDAVEAVASEGAAAAKRALEPASGDDASAKRTKLSAEDNVREPVDKEGSDTQAELDRARAEAARKRGGEKALGKRPVVSEGDRERELAERQAEFLAEMEVAARRLHDVEVEVKRGLAAIRDRVRQEGRCCTEEEMAEMRELRMKRAAEKRKMLDLLGDTDDEVYADIPHRRVRDVIRGGLSGSVRPHSTFPGQYEESDDDEVELERAPVDPATAKEARPEVEPRAFYMKKSSSKCGFTLAYEGDTPIVNDSRACGEMVRAIAGSGIAFQEIDDFYYAPDIEILCRQIQRVATYAVHTSFRYDRHLKKMLRLEEIRVDRMREAVEMAEKRVEAKYLGAAETIAGLNAEIEGLRRRLETKETEVAQVKQDLVNMAHRNQELVRKNDELKAKSERDASDLRASFTEQVRVESLRHSRSRADAVERLQKLQQYVEYKARIKDRYLASNQLYGNLRFIEYLAAKEGIVIPERVATGLQLKKEGHDDWLNQQAEVELVDGDFVLPEIVSELEARDNPSVTPPSGIDQYGTQSSQH